MVVVKLITDDDGNKYPNKYWHYYTVDTDAPRVLCTGECFGFGESPLKYIKKEGKITCPRCIEKIKVFQKIKL